MSQLEISPSSTNSDDLAIALPWRRVWNWPRAVDISVAALLLATAALKAISPSQAITTAATWGMDYPVVIFVVQVELLLAAWLLSRTALKLARFVTASMFLFFATISLVLALQGHTSCGCFGQLKMDPWMMFLLDSSVVLAFLWAALVATPCPTTTKSPFRSISFAYPGLAPLALTAMLIHRPETLVSSTTMVGSSNIVILEPETWIGEKCPLAEHVAPSVDFAEKKSTVLVYHHDCPACQEALPNYVNLAKQNVDRDQQVVLVEVPPLGNEREPSAAIHTTLPDDRDWFVQAPVELVIDQGIVTSVRQLH